MAKTKRNLDSAGEAVVLANHPGFIFKRLRKLDVVREVSETHSTDEIIRQLVERDRKPAKTAWDVVQQYVWLVALALNNPKEVLPRLEALKLNRLQWSEDLKGMIRASLVPTNRIVVDARSEPVGISSGSRASVNRIVLSGRS
jgi:hypothetical protein